MLRVGFVGWRGMVGSVLMDRMRQEGDFAGIAPTFFSTSAVGGPAPDVGQGAATLADAESLEKLAEQEVIVTCQGGDYTTSVHGRLRGAGWGGYWIDAASTLRMSDEAVLILDPVNLDVIRAGLRAGRRVYVGPNCTVSLMLMAFVGLFRAGLVEWVSSMTYQAASGAGAANMKELADQMLRLGRIAEPLLGDAGSSALELERRITLAQRDGSLPSTHFKAPLAASLIPWIDRAVEDGQTREEWKGHAETNKILGLSPAVPVDGICVRVGALRCHSQGVTLKLRRDVPLADLTGLIAGGNPWVRVIENTQAATLAGLTPAAVSGSLDVPVGRLRKMKLGPEFLTGFTVGDQLLWGAAEPLRRMVLLLREHLGR